MAFSSDEHAALLRRIEALLADAKRLENTAHLTCDESAAIVERSNRIVREWLVKEGDSEE